MMEKFDIIVQFKRMKENETCVILKVDTGNQIKAMEVDVEFIDLVVKLYNLNRCHVINFK